MIWKIALSAAAILLLGGWLVLFVGDRAILVWETKPDEDEAIPMLDCKYFTATGFANRRHLYSKRDFMGRSECPGIVDPKEAGLIQ